MNKLISVVIGCLLCSCYAVAKITINEINGPEYVEEGTIDELALDCDFDTHDEQGVVVKWFFNSDNVQIYQWITSQRKASPMGPMRENIDATYMATNDSRTFLRALKFKSISPDISGNYTCKVTGDESEASLTKQLIVYSPATTFKLDLISGNAGDEAVFCDADNVTPKPIFELDIEGFNDTTEWPLGVIANKTVTEDERGYYNMSIMVQFNSSYLETGTTRFVCSLSIPGTNYSETKSVEQLVESDIVESIELTSESYSNENLTEEVRYDDVRDNGLPPLASSLATILILIFPIILAI